MKGITITMYVEMKMVNCGRGKMTLIARVVALMITLKEMNLHVEFIGG